MKMRIWKWKFETRELDAAIDAVMKESEE